LALIALRIATGFHFFQEGVVKLRSGDFTAKYFLSEAKGPVAPFFKSFLDDPDGTIRLCLKTENPLMASESELVAPEISPEFTQMIWDDFGDRIKDHYRLDEAENTKVTAILNEHKLYLEEFLDENRPELIAYFGGYDRQAGFSKDGQQRQIVAQQVASLGSQIDTIKSDRKKKFQGWSSQVESIWDSLETQLNLLPVKGQSKPKPLPLHRPFDQPYSWQKIIDQVIPWFDTIVGALLIVGFLTRFASLAAAGFLTSVIATQPPWIPGTTPTMLYLIELIGCMLLFATAAGRFGGLDFFRWASTRQDASPRSPTPL
jgi:uncharacterized membrane protein YphA (DoxX/SURF4 family)